MNSPELGAVEVPGGKIAYAAQGAGPVLLVIQGGAGNHAFSAGIAGRLSEHYTVLSYDRRGLSASRLRDGETPPTIATHISDAHHLLRAVTGEPAVVFGSSIGAVIALGLAAAHPQQVHTLIAHEPPSPHFLSDSERETTVAEVAGVVDAFRGARLGDVMDRLRAINGLDLDGRELDAPSPPQTPQQQDDFLFFLTHDFAAVTGYAVDTDALADPRRRIALAGGRGSRPYFPYRAARGLAEVVGAPFVEFPGGHNGYLTRPAEFADRLRQIVTSFPDRPAATA